MGAVSKYIRIDAPRSQVYELWRDPSNFPRFMPDVKSVENHGDHWHWELSGPIGTTVKFDSVVVEDVPGVKLAWKSTSGNTPNSGVVRFDDRGDATDMEYALEFDPPLGKAGEVVATLFDDPEDKVERALVAFKELAEHAARPS